MRQPRGRRQTSPQTSVPFSLLYCDPPCARLRRRQRRFQRMRAPDLIARSCSYLYTQIHNRGKSCTFLISANEPVPFFFFGLQYRFLFERMPTACGPGEALHVSSSTVVQYNRLSFPSLFISAHLPSLSESANHWPKCNACRAFNRFEVILNLNPILIS